MRKLKISISWKTACKLASKVNVLPYIVKPHNVKEHNNRAVWGHVSQAILKKNATKIQKRRSVGEGKRPSTTTHKAVSLHRPKPTGNLWDCAGLEGRIHICV